METVSCFPHPEAVIKKKKKKEEESDGVRGRGGSPRGGGRGRDEGRRSPVQRCCFNERTS